MEPNDGQHSCVARFAGLVCGIGLAGRTRARTWDPLIKCLPLTTLRLASSATAAGIRKGAAGIGVLFTEHSAAERTAGHPSARFSNLEVRWSYNSTRPFWYKTRALQFLADV